MGLEALSRGAQEAHFIELDPWVLQNVLKRNVRDCRMEAKAKLYASKVSALTLSLTPGRGSNGCTAQLTLVLDSLRVGMLRITSQSGDPMMGIYSYQEGCLVAAGGYHSVDDNSTVWVTDESEFWGVAPAASNHVVS